MALIAPIFGVALLTSALVAGFASHRSSLGGDGLHLGLRGE
jgi:hypothetical protein